MKKSFVAKNLDELASVSRDMVSALGETRVVCLSGSMGAGKTTLVKTIVAVLGAEEDGNSPTFSLINVYNSPIHGDIFHLDLYRLNSTSEALDIGIEDVLYDGLWCFIEWPEHIQNLLPETYATISITVDEAGFRQFELETIHAN
jgi:tRNA threonylcarbamoyladenosine biosynthesis protein TsaE